MKKNQVFFLCGLLTVIAGCTKNTAEKMATANSPNQQNSFAASSATEFGSMKVGATKMQTRKDSYKNLGVTLTRITLDAKKPNDYIGYNQLYDAGYHVILTVDWGSSNPAPFPSATEFKTNLQTLLNNIKTKPPAAVCILREPTNLLYHTGSMNSYIAVLTAAIEVCHSMGFSISDGGLHPQGLTWWCYQDYVQRGLTDSANFMKTLFTPTATSYLNHWGSDDFGDYTKRVDTLLDAYKGLALDYVNCHLYESASFSDWGTTPHPYKAFINYYKKVTGKPVISDAYTISDIANTTLLSQSMANIKDAGFSKVVYFDSNDSQSKPLTYNKVNGKADGSDLTSMGTTYKANK